MPVSSKQIYLWVLLTVAILALVIVLVVRSSENFDSFKNKHIIKRYDYSPSESSVNLQLSLHPDKTLRDQIDNNIGQLERLKILIEDSLYDMSQKNYLIDEIKIFPAVTMKDEDFLVDGVKYPRKTYALFDFRRKDNNARALIPVSADPSFGAGVEELIYSQINNEIKKNSSVTKIL